MRAHVDKHQCSVVPYARTFLCAVIRQSCSNTLNAHSTSIFNIFGHSICLLSVGPDGRQCAMRNLVLLSEAYSTLALALEYFFTFRQWHIQKTG